MVLRPPVPTKHFGFPVGFCGDRRPSAIYDVTNHGKPWLKPIPVRRFNIKTTLPGMWIIIIIKKRCLWDHFINMLEMPYRSGESLILKRLPERSPWDRFAWWRHQMETFSALLALCAGNSPIPVNSPHKGQWRGALMFSLICVWINGWVNNHEAGDLRRYRGHYDVVVMVICLVERTRTPRKLSGWFCQLRRYLHEFSLTKYI